MSTPALTPTPVRYVAPPELTPADLLEMATLHLDPRTPVDKQNVPAVSSLVNHRPPVPLVRNKFAALEDMDDAGPDHPCVDVAPVPAAVLQETSLNCHNLDPTALAVPEPRLVSGHAPELAVPPAAVHAVEATSSASGSVCSGPVRIGTPSVRVSQRRHPKERVRRVSFAEVSSDQSIAPHSDASNHPLFADGQSAHAPDEQSQAANHPSILDWNFDHSEFLRLSATFGPFSKLAVNLSGTELLSLDFSGHSTWCIPPFRMTPQILKHYLTCKARAPTTTSLFIVIPESMYLRSLACLGPLSKLRPIQRYPAGCSPFTRPQPTSLEPTRRVPIKPLSYSLVVCYDPPETLAPPVAPSSSPADAQPCVSALSELVFVSQISAPPDSLSSPLLIIRAKCKEEDVLILVDSGASRDFANRHSMKRLALEPDALPKPLRVKLADGSISSTCTCTTAVLSVASYCEPTTFVLTDLCGVDFIFGKPWLALHNPRIDWSTNTILEPFHIEASQAPETPSLSLLSAEKMAKFISCHDVHIAICTLKEIPEPPKSNKNAADTDPLCPSTCLSAGGQRQLHKLLHEFSVAFEPPSGVNIQTGVTHTIPLKPDSKPPIHGLCRMSPAELEELQKQLTMYLEKGWIRPSTSAFGAPVVFAKKADGTLRFCVDYRALNAITIKNAYPLPRIDDLLDQLHGAQFFTSLDLTSAYHQIPMEPSDIHKTAFRTRYGHYEFTVMPFGLTNAPATCQQVTNDVLRPYLDKFTSVYLDDCLIWSKTEAEHLEHIRLVLDAFTRSNLRFKLPKCLFAQKQTKFLGYIVSADGVSADPQKIAALMDWPLPTSTTEVRSFLGFCNFYRKMVRNYSTIAAPLSALTSALQPFPHPLPVAAQEAFHQLKLALSTAPVLCIPQTGTEASFDLYTDASRVGLGAVLEQDGRPVCFESRKLSPAEQNYPVHELELLAVVHALRVFRHYLEGCKHFTLFTDHQSLKFFFTQKELSRRQVGWMETLVDFQPNMDIRYLKGEKNKADALSRKIADASGLEYISAMFEIVTPDLYSSIIEAYAVDPYYSPAKCPAFVRKCSDGLFRFHDRICVPANDELRTRLLAEFHDAPSAGHPGFLRTMNAIAAHFWWPHMTKTVHRYVASCDTCQRIKPGNHGTSGLLFPHAVPSRPWSHISMDLIVKLPKSVGPDGQVYDSILTFVDLLTKQAFFIRCREDMSAVDLAHLYIDNVYRLKGLSTFIVSDRDTRITSEFWQTLFHQLGTTLNMSTAYHPQTDGQTERAHRTIEQILRAYVDPMHDDWAVWLPLAEFAYNSATNASTSLSPFEANYGYQPSTPATLSSPNLQHPAQLVRGCRVPSSRLSTGATAALDFATRLSDLHRFIQHQSAAAKERQAALANRGRHEVTFPVGSYVMLSSDKLSLSVEQPSSKLRDRWLGPFMVSQVVSPVAYRLQLPSHMQIHPVVHVSRLKAAATPDPAFKTRPASRRARTAAATDQPANYDYVVDRILDVRISPKTGRTLEFLVHWAPPWEDTCWDSWEPYMGIRHTHAFDAFAVSPAFTAFKSTPAYLKFQQSFPRSCPPLGPHVPIVLPAS